MSKKILYISDFFLEHIVGGGELNDDELIKILKTKGHTVEKIQSHLLTSKIVDKNKDSFFIVSNFCNLAYDVREKITYEIDYILYEHDHKYLETRNPIFYKDLKSSCVNLRNYFLYKNAKKVFCQTDYHKKILLKNLDIENVIAVNGNLWSLDVLEKLRVFSKKEKKDKVSILDSHIKHKNTTKAIAYCHKKSLDYELVKDKNYESFLNKLSNNQKFMFFPGSPETLSRIVCEARMMGMSVTLNQLIGASHEEWFGLKGEELIDYMIGKRETISNMVVSEVEKPRENKTDKEISIITTFHKAEEFLTSYLDNITNQTIFNKCELVLVDSASPGREQQIVEEYMKKFDNIKYYRYDKNFKPTIGHNIAIRKSNCKYVVWAMIDDRKSIDGIEALYNQIKNDNSIELVYGDCLVTNKKHETPETTESETLSEHSRMPFSKQNMIKCLPGPMPMWRKRLHEKCGFFDEIRHDFSDDWDLWLRAVNNGCQFKKVQRVVGLYLEGGRSQWENNLEQRKEEARIFFKYKHIFGINYAKYFSYFNQFIEMNND